MEVFYAWFDLRFTCIKHVLVHVTLCNYRYIFVLAHTLVAKFQIDFSCEYALLLIHVAVIHCIKLVIYLQFLVVSVYLSEII